VGLATVREGKEGLEARSGLEACSRGLETKPSPFGCLRAVACMTAGIG